ncbi:30S ribosomal protein S8 [Chlamydiales bacterium SCGC AB-751-O23]|jgi:small subunit ribosomal protein S8|nr:30S ribosomal protein S8 [Chlamydiales bacterium SCGC AB-751-O23]
MTLSDPIADLLTRIRNASTAKHKFMDVSWSKIKEEIVKVLLKEGFVKHYLLSKEEPKRTLRIYLKYGAARKPVINAINRYSKPGVRKYVTKDEIPMVLGGMGTAILTTSKGVMSGLNAKKESLGGEVLCFVW